MAKVKNIIPCPSCGSSITKAAFLASQICESCGDDLSDDKDVLKAFGLYDEDDDDDDFYRLIQNSSKYGKQKNTPAAQPVEHIEHNEHNEHIEHIEHKTPIHETAPVVEETSAPLDAAALQARLREMTANKPTEEFVQPEADPTPKVVPPPQIKHEPLIPQSAPEAPVADIPVIEVPVVEAPVIEVPVAETPVEESPKKVFNTQRIVQLADGRFLDTVSGEILEGMTPVAEPTVPAEDVEEESANNLVNSMVNKISTTPLKKTKNIADVMRENLETNRPSIDANSYDMAPNEKKENIEGYNSNSDHYYDDTEASIPPEPDIIKTSTIRNAVLCVAGLFLFAAFMIYYI